MSTVVIVGILATTTFLYVRRMLKRLEPATLRRTAEAACAYRAAMGQQLEVADAERRIRRTTKVGIVGVTAIALAVIVVEVVSNL